MLICLHPPFGGRKVAQEKVWEEIPLDRAMPSGDFLVMIKKRYLDLVPYIQESEDETFYHLLIFRSGYALQKHDLIQPDDRIEIMMPLTGG